MGEEELVNKHLQLEKRAVQLRTLAQGQHPMVARAIKRRAAELELAVSVARWRFEAELRRGRSAADPKGAARSSPSIQAA